MECRDFERWVSLSQDGELCAEEEGELRSHLKVCAECRDSSGALLRMNECLKDHLKGADNATAPLSLKTRVRRDIRESEDQGSSTVKTLVPSAVIGMAASLLIFAWTKPVQKEDQFPDHVVIRHSRNYPPEVRTEEDDPAPVLRHIDRNISYPVRVPRFHAKNPNVRLVGARLSVIEDRDAVQLIYDHRGARISVFPYPRSSMPVEDRGGYVRRVGGRPVRVTKHRGYNVVRWDQGDLSYSAVSDVDQNELVQFVTHSAE